MNTVVFDLDDTLLHDDLTISDYTVTVLRRLYDKGFHIIAASGRAFLSMKPFVEQIACVSLCISCNGAEIRDASSGSMLFSEMLPVETAKAIALFAEEHNCYAQVYDSGSFFFNKRGIYAQRYASTSKLSGVFIGKLSDYIREPRNKILLIDDESRIASMYTVASVMFSGKAAVTCSKPYFLEFNPPDTSKGKALEKVTALLGTSCKDAVVFGDSLNDVSMLQKAGLSVAVANGWESVRSGCDAVCGSNNQDGPAHFLADRFLSGEVIL